MQSVSGLQRQENTYSVTGCKLIESIITESRPEEVHIHRHVIFAKALAVIIAALLEDCSSWP